MGRLPWTILWTWTYPTWPSWCSALLCSVLFCSALWISKPEWKHWVVVTGAKSSGEEERVGLAIKGGGGGKGAKGFLFEKEEKEKRRKKKKKKKKNKKKKLNKTILAQT